MLLTIFAPRRRLATPRSPCCPRRRPVGFGARAALRVLVLRTRRLRSLVATQPEMPRATEANTVATLRDRLETSQAKHHAALSEQNVYPCASNRWVLSG